MDTRIVRTALALALATIATPTPGRAADVSSSPGRTAVFETRHYANGPTNFRSVQGQILKAKSKHVLTITVSAFTLLVLGNSQALSLHAYLNGSVVDPFAFGAHCPQTTNYCSVHAQWIVDLDAAEAAAPGTVIGQPLDALVQITDGYGNTASQVDLSMAMRMEKKR